MCGVDALKSDDLNSDAAAISEAIREFVVAFNDANLQNRGWVLTRDRRMNEPLSFFSTWHGNWLVAVDREFGIGQIFSSPLVANGTVYFGSPDGFLYVLE
jgi:outer membrane protein assembly factor BamB